MPGNVIVKILSYYILFFVGVEPEPFELGEHLIDASGKFMLHK